MTTPTRKPSWLHRLLRFSLFSFLVGIGILAGVFGWLRHRAEQQRLAVEWITSQGGEIRYTHYKELKTNVYYSLGSDEDKAQRASLRPDNTWLANTLGEHYVHRVESIFFHQSLLTGDVWRLRHAHGAKRIRFIECDLSAEVFEALGNCASLEEVSISDCRIDADGLAHFEKLTALKNLFLEKISLKAGSLRHLGRCQKLEMLGLTFCEFPAEDFSSLASLTHLKFLGVGFTSVGDEQLRIIASLRKLERLDVGDRVTDAGVDQLQGLVNLDTLTFIQSKVTDEGIVKLIHLPKLKSVQFSDCRLSDELIMRLGNEEPHWTVSYVR